MNIIELANNCDYDTLSALGFVGTDISLEISLDEYQLAIKDNHDEIGNYLVICKDSQNNWDWWQGTENDIMEKFHESWFEKESFLSFVGSVESDWLALPLIVKLGDMVSYYGTQDILGCY